MAGGDGMSEPQVVKIHPDSKYVIVLGNDTLVEDAKVIAEQLDAWWSDPDTPFFVVFGDIRLEKVKVEPGDEQIIVLASRLALLAATQDTIIATLRDRGDKNMADMLDNAWYIAFGDALGTPKATAPEGGAQ